MSVLVGRRRSERRAYALYLELLDSAPLRAQLLPVPGIVLVIVIYSELVCRSILFAILVLSSTILVLV